MEIVMWFVFLWSAYALSREKRKPFRAERIGNNKTDDIVVKVEEYTDQVYLWNKETEEFLSQGKDFEEAISKCVERFPGVTFKVLRSLNETSQR